MFRVDTSTATDSPPTPSPAGTPGYFRSGNPQAGIPATIPGADWFNTMQEELAGLVEHYGLNLDKTDRTQLRQAIEAAIAAATLRYDIASRSQAEAGTDNVALMTPLRVAQAVNALSAGCPPVALLPARPERRRTAIFRAMARRYRGRPTRICSPPSERPSERRRLYDLQRAGPARRVFTWLGQRARC